MLVKRVRLDAIRQMNHANMGRNSGKFASTA